MQNALQNPDNAGASSMDYLYLFGLTGLAFGWALMAKAAIGKSDDFYKTKLATGRYFVERMLPDAHAHLMKIKTGAAPVMALAAEAF